MPLRHPAVALALSYLQTLQAESSLRGSDGAIEPTDRPTDQQKRAFDNMQNA